MYVRLLNDEIKGKDKFLTHFKSTCGIICILKLINNCKVTVYFTYPQFVYTKNIKCDMILGNKSIFVLEV